MSFTTDIFNPAELAVLEIAFLGVAGETKAETAPRQRARDVARIMLEENVRSRAECNK
jgi:hypothetical protein